MSDLLVADWLICDLSLRLFVGFVPYLALRKMTNDQGPSS